MFFPIFSLKVSEIRISNYEDDLPSGWAAFSVPLLGVEGETEFSMELGDLVASFVFSSVLSPPEVL